MPANLYFPRRHESHFLRQMTLLAELSDRLTAGHSLTDEEVTAAAGALTETDDDETTPLKTRFLAALADKGETPAEVAAFARAFRERAINPRVERWAPHAIDIVGTGGDHAGAFNISSMVVFTLACAGVPVMKHGNRGITSKCGSADLLTGLGANIEASPEKLQDSLAQLGFAFFFAPAYHPAFRHIAPARKQLAAQGRRSIFNILGPLINPGRPAHILLGVFADQWVPLMAEVHHLLGTRSGIAVHSHLPPAADGKPRGIDELTTTGPNRVRGIGRLRDLDDHWIPGTPALANLPQAPLADLMGGDLEQNLAIVDNILAGRAPAGLVDTITLNAATCLWITGKTPSPAEALPFARELLLGGAVKTRIAATREFFAKN